MADGFCKGFLVLRLSLRLRQRGRLSDQPPDTTPSSSVKIPWPSGGWRLEVAAFAQDMYYLSRWFHAQSAVPTSQALVDAIEAHLSEVQHSLSQRFGANPTSILGHLAAAQENLLYMAPLSYVRGCMPSLVMQSRRALDANDLQLTTLEALAKKTESN